jgi:DNA-directed RNA polymerase subunit beta
MAGLKRREGDGRVSFSKIAEIIAIPNLIEIQQRSFEQFLQMRVKPPERQEIGLQAVFTSIFPIADYDESASLEFVRYDFGEPKYTPEECREKGMTYSVPLKVTLNLVVCEKAADGETRSIRDIKQQEVYLGEMPLMTEHGTFIINGTERVVVSQLHRSPGAFFDHDAGKTHPSGKTLFSARLIPYRGSWLEFEFDANEVLHVRIDRRRKFLAAVLLRAIGYGSHQAILDLFYEADVVSVQKGRTFLVEVSPQATLGWRVSKDLADGRETILPAGKRVSRAILKRLQAAKLRHIPVDREDVLGRFLAADVHDPQTGELLVECAQALTAETLDRLLERGVTEFKTLAGTGEREVFEMRETVVRDETRTEEEALLEIYRRMRPGDPPTLESTRALLDGLFFNPRRYDLSKVGRHKLNQKLGMDVPLDVRVLRQEDIVAIVRYLLRLKRGEGQIDDIDHLGNRRVRSAGELLEDQFRIGLARMERAVRERMSTQELETLMPHDLVNAKPVTAALKEFFGSSQLSQFMDQTNPLAELTHKRRLSALGPGGLSRERAGFEVRDVHPTHYGRMCPIETPEGPNVGLIASLSTYARVNDFGFIETPYRKVRNGRVTDDIEYLTADIEEQYTIAQANADLDPKGKLLGDRVSARRRGNFVMVPPGEVQYIDVSPKQLVGVSTSLIPFLEHDDANRALMGANMQRQAVPLLRPEVPVVGTGMEYVAAKDSGAVVVARRSGVVEAVSAERIIIRADDPSEENGSRTGSAVDIYSLQKFRRSNQNTCINQKPIVAKGERVAKGQVIADGPATANGELALGQNVLVAFMPWGGYNFEDAILISERLVKDDRYTSVHIEEFEIEARDTKLGKEEITRDIPNVGEDALKDLDESGIIRIGAEVKPGDILVGKVTPKGETVLTPEERLLRAIFGEKAEDVRDASLYVPPGISGTVVDVRVFSRKGIDKDERAKSIEDDEIARLRKDFEDEIAIIGSERDRQLREAMEGRLVGRDVKARRSPKILVSKRKKLTRELLDGLSHDDLLLVAEALPDEVVQAVTRRSESADNQIHMLQTILEERINRLRKGDELAPGVFKMVKVYVAMKRKLSVGDKMAGRHGNKGVIAKILPEEDMPYLPDGTPVEVVLNPLGVPSRMNVGQVLETHLGWAAQALGLAVASPVFDGATEQEIKAWLKRAKLPTGGKIALRDGRTGRPFHQEVAVGYIYLMKLAHLVDDKIHARSIGPYSLVTQQPLGGKAQFGGQRFGEMEVWALEGYGAAHILQEILTVKSDDVVGRTKMYESIVKGDNTLEPGLPESFNVLMRELQSLALDVELIK